MAYGKAYVHSDKRRGEALQDEEKEKYGMKDLPKSYQSPSEKYTNGKTKDVKVAPPKKKKQMYGGKKNAAGSMTGYGNNKAMAKSAGEKFAKSGKMPKPKKIRSIADLRKRAKKMSY